MGSDKSALPFDAHTSLLERQIQLIQALSLDELLLCGKPEHELGIKDQYPGHGPLAGIHAAMLLTQQDYLLIIPVDMPLLREGDLATLLTAKSALCPVHYQRHCLPLVLPKQETILAWIEQQFQHANSREWSLRRLYERFGTITLNHSEPIHLSNTNTPEQWQQCLDVIK